MNDRCTPATARRLKELGFAQPVPAPGQVWYTINDTKIIVTGRKGQTFFCATKGGNSLTEIHVSHFDDFADAPTASDILRELGEDWTMIVAGGGFQIYKHFQDPQYIFPIAANENPAEACAEAWEVKQKAQ